MFLQEGSKSWEFYLQTPYLAIPETRFHIKNRGLRFGRVGNLPAWVAGINTPPPTPVKPVFITFPARRGQCARRAQELLSSRRHKWFLMRMVILGIAPFDSNLRA